MIKRHQYIAYLKEEYMNDQILQEYLEEDKKIVSEDILKKHFMTIALYHHKNMVFLYYEELEHVKGPDEMFPFFTACLEKVPFKTDHVKWIPMNVFYYNAIPKTTEQWFRNEKKGRIGKIAYIMPDKLLSYMYYHKALLDEGLFDGERYLSIASHDTILFTYSETPRILTHLNTESDEASAVIEEWRKLNPKSHFDHNFSGDENFVQLKELLTLGWEEIFSE